MKLTLFLPTSLLIVCIISSRGKTVSGSLINAAVTDSVALMIACERSSLTFAIASSPAATTRSQPSKRSASPAGILTALMAF